MDNLSNHYDINSETSYSKHDNQTRYKNFIRSLFIFILTPNDSSIHTNRTKLDGLKGSSKFLLLIDVAFSFVSDDVYFLKIN